MKVICPRCNEGIEAKYSNKSKGLAYCTSCDDYYALDEHLRRSPYLVRREKKFTNASKPSKSKTEIKETAGGFSIMVADGRLSFMIRIFLMVFLGAIAYGLYQIISGMTNPDPEQYFAIGTFLLITVFIILILLLKGPNTILNLDKDTVQINRNRYVLSPYSRTKKTNTLDKIDTYFESDNEGGSYSGIEMTFEGTTSLRFGHNLSNGEQDWLTGQLILIRDALTLDDKVTHEIEGKLSSAKKNPLVINTTQPIQSNFRLIEKPGARSIVIPKDRRTWNTLLILLLYIIGVSIFGTVTIGFWGFLPAFEHHPIMKYVFSVFTLLAAYGLFYYLYTFIYRAKHRVSISPAEIAVELQPFGIHHSKIRPTEALTDIVRSREWNCVLLKFKGYSDLRVGFILKKEELVFLIGELKRLTEEVDSSKF